MALSRFMTENYIPIDIMGLPFVTKHRQRISELGIRSRARWAGREMESMPGLPGIGPNLNWRESWGSEMHELGLQRPSFN